jgi:hypothetical protein
MRPAPPSWASSHSASPARCSSLSDPPAGGTGAADGPADGAPEPERAAGGGGDRRLAEAWCAADARFCHVHPHFKGTWVLANGSDLVRDSPCALCCPRLPVDLQYGGAAVASPSQLAERAKAQVDLLRCKRQASR